MDFEELRSLYSTDEEMLELEDRDVTTNITGYVDATTAPVPAGKNKESLFKFILTNGTKKIVVLIWGVALINKYCKDICSSRIININGGHCKSASMSKFKESNGYVPFEILIKENTEVTFLGYHLVEGQTKNDVQKATFDNIHMLQGLIEISGYIRTKFSLMHTQNGTLSYGVGAITDGIKKLTIQIKKFEECQLPLGSYVTVTGTVTGQDSIVVIFCESISNIKLHSEKEPLSSEKLQRGGRPVKRIRSKETMV